MTPIWECRKCYALMRRGEEKQKQCLCGGEMQAAYVFADEKIHWTEDK